MLERKSRIQVIGSVCAEGQRVTILTGAIRVGANKVLASKQT